MDETVEALENGGLAAGSIREDLVTSETPVRAIVSAAADHDVVVMGESEPSLRAFLFGEAEEQIAAHSVGPVPVVRRPREGEDDTQDEGNTEDEAGDEDTGG